MVILDCACQEALRVVILLKVEFRPVRTGRGVGLRTRHTKYFCLGLPLFTFTHPFSLLPSLLFNLLRCLFFFGTCREGRTVCNNSYLIQEGYSRASLGEKQGEITTASDDSHFVYLIPTDKSFRQEGRFSFYSIISVLSILGLTDRSFRICRPVISCWKSRHSGHNNILERTEGKWLLFRLRSHNGTVLRLGNCQDGRNQL